MEFRCQNYSIGCKEIISVDNYEEHYSSCVNDKLLEEFKAFFKGEMERKKRTKEVLKKEDENGEAKTKKKHVDQK